jgi:hypothetical protein
MLNTSVKMWVKNVNNQRIETGINSVFISPILHAWYVSQATTSEQPQVTHQTLPSFNQLLSTIRIRFSYPLNTVFTQFPQHLLIERTNEN